jgi:hypothetical protein
VSENCTTKTKDKTRITATELKFIRRKSIYTSKTEPVLDKILKYKTKWIQYPDRMQGDRLPKLTLQTTWTNKLRPNLKETFGQLKLEQVNKWPSSLTAR